MARRIYVGFILILLTITEARTQQITRIDPTFWWVGMKNPKVQLLVYGPSIAQSQVSLNYPGVKLEKVKKVENPNYLFLDLNINPTAKAGKLNFTFSGAKKTTYTYELKARNTNPKGQGVSSKDFIYLVLPDRFANADESNDNFADMADPEADRQNPFLRHGGDITGITNHLDYFQELGVTALWLNPVIENNQPQTNEGGSMRSAYHGYGFTDHYQVDKRLGGNEAYLKFVQAAHAKNLRVVQDAVYNHLGINHWILKDPPSKDWVHQWPTYTNTSYKFQPVLDPYSALSDKKITLDGWFVPFLPDLNQENAYVANYLIQHALWTVEYFGVDAWRIDTYLYNNQAFMNRCNQALLEEYPNIHIFGESWVNNVISQAYFVKNKINFPFKCNQPGTLDFVLWGAFNQALNQKSDWNENLVYQVLAQDAVYENPLKLVTFLDNHDMDRYYSVIGEDFNKYKIGITWLLTTRGIPSLYYGTEILMKNFKNPSDAEVRKDFPGGFKGDKENKFTATGRTAAENEAFNFVKKLAQYRKATPALHSGKLMQYLPQNNTYVYFRFDAAKTIMVATNPTDQEITLETSRFAERMSGFNRARNVLTEEVQNSLATLKLPAKSALVLELLK
ncbi:glycoside hydrolase family 13 protein [Adhaeribacter radiodurans]|uniref:Glycoside hydrolase family 13 protein n=1 Tax=Adhaeribacter radiodurans TaxID=2745197 RepID=A0A7L7L8U6_9BACT|nr:glycoside hydrolase family 13 protein [Adhaeribacter radiodurans]QMU29250.1 glycoside hydrolase family 13 protein [Adhaeribacter radiodurans]